MSGNVEGSDFSVGWMLYRQYLQTVLTRARLLVLLASAVLVAGAIVLLLPLSGSSTPEDVALHVTGAGVAAVLTVGIFLRIWQRKNRAGYTPAGVISDDSVKEIERAHAEKRSPLLTEADHSKATDSAAFNRRALPLAISHTLIVVLMVFPLIPMMFVPSLAIQGLLICIVPLLSLVTGVRLITQLGRTTMFFPPPVQSTTL